MQRMVVFGLWIAWGVIFGFDAILRSEDVSSAFDRPSLNVDAMKGVLIHSGGRRMPLDTYARSCLLRWSTRSHYVGVREKEDATEWLVRLLFTPIVTGEDEVFRILHPEVLDALRLPRGAGIKPKRRYSFHDLFPSIGVMRDLDRRIRMKTEDERNRVEKEIMRVYRNVLDYFLLMESMSMGRVFEHASLEREALTHQKARERLGLVAVDDALRPSYWWLYKNVHSHLKDLVRQYQSVKDTNVFTDVDWEVLSFLESYFVIYEAGLHRDFFRIVPFRQGEKVTWFSPWQGLVHGAYRDEGMDGLKNMEQMLDLLEGIMGAYELGDQEKFDEAVRTFTHMQRGVSETDSLQAKASKLNRISLEVFYHNISPFTKAKVLYMVSFLLGLLSMMKFLGERVLRWMERLAVIGLVLGCGVHGFGILLRVVITGRPPISNLYETFVFVSIVTVIMGLVMEGLSKMKIGYLAGSFGGLVLLLISLKFVQDGDTMGVLVAVLRSNFWLSTHVIAINLGYGGIIFSGLMGHVYLLTLMFGRRTPQTVSARDRNLFRLVYGTQGFGLLLTVTGTMLGGIWADQSWGRFWGWDPKENGALLIILWSAILFHARMIRWISPLGFAAGSVMNIIVVMLAWFGINLLGVGMHSYGFAEGLALGLFTYIGLQMSVLFLILYLLFVRTAHLRSSVP